jgi:hypothetical protein
MADLDLTEFRDSGLLQEVNRQWFHPRGLALYVWGERDGPIASIAGIRDFRDDPEGVYMALDQADVERGEQVAAELEARRAEREARLGWMIQPLEVYPD